MPSSNLKNIILLIICGMLTTMLIGFLFTGTRIFHPDQPPFQFIAGGFLGSLLFAMLSFRTKKDFAAAFAFYILLDIIVFRFMSIPLIITRILFAAVFALCIIAYWRFVLPQRPFWLRPLSLAGLLACAVLVLLLVLSIFFKRPDVRSLIEAQTFFDLLIGFGLGVGFEVFSFVRKKQLT